MSEKEFATKEELKKLNVNADPVGYVIDQFNDVFVNGKAWDIPKIMKSEKVPDDATNHAEENEHDSRPTERSFKRSDGQTVTIKHVFKRGKRPGNASTSEKEGKTVRKQESEDDSGKSA